jgi:hypothetical protein
MKAGWETKPLGEVLQKTEIINPQQSPNAEIDYIDVSSVSNTTFQIETTQRLREGRAKSRLLARTRAGTYQRPGVHPKGLPLQVAQIHKMKASNMMGLKRILVVWGGDL